MIETVVQFLGRALWRKLYASERKKRSCIVAPAFVSSFVLPVTLKANVVGIARGKKERQKNREKNRKKKQQIEYKESSSKRREETDR
jgi:hypothetical protein